MEKLIILVITLGLLLGLSGWGIGVEKNLIEEVTREEKIEPSYKEIKSKKAAELVRRENKKTLNLFPVWAPTDQKITYLKYIEEFDIASIEIRPYDIFISPSIKAEKKHLKNLYGEIYYVNLDTGKMDKLISGKVGRRPNWSSDGSKLVFYSTEGICMMDLKTRTKEIILKNIPYLRKKMNVDEARYFFNPVWCPDGEKIVIKIGYYEGGQLGFINAKEKKVYYLEPRQGGYFWWSPNNDKIVTAAEARIGEGGVPSWKPGIFIYDFIKKNSTNLLHTSIDDTKGAFYPYWDKDNRIYFFYQEVDRRGPVENDIVNISFCSVNSDGSQLRKIRQWDLKRWTDNGAWSVNGRFAFVKEGNIWIMDTKLPSNLFKVTDFGDLPDDSSVGLSWSHDGSKLAFSYKGSIWMLEINK